MDAANLKAWLPFDMSATEDKLGNTWTAYGTTSISDVNAINKNALQLNKGYLRSDGQITFGGADFTISLRAYLASNSHNWGGLFCAQPTTNTGNSNNAGRISFFRSSNSNNLALQLVNASNKTVADGEIVASNFLNGLHHFELDYIHADSTLKIFIDGQLTYTKNVAIERLARYIYLGCTGYDPDGQRMSGTIDEFLLFDGTALHTENFSPPTSDDYFALALELDGSVPVTLDFDVKRKVINAEKTWRYVNLGSADSLTITGTTLTNLPESKSRTGTAFYQTTGAKCFDLPATSEIWLKFDVYFDGSNRWRAYNDGTNGLTGITAQTSGDLSFFNNGTNVQQPTGICKKNQLQTVLLHMISGSSAGVIEAWVDEQFIYRYTGAVNHGEDFADIYLQSDGAGIFFSNVVISNRQLTQADGYQSFTVDVERKLSNVVEFTADVERYLIEPLIVPFLMGEHFNHYIRSIIVSNSPTTFKLPKKSKVYIHATSPVDTSPRAQWRAVRIFTDTDAAGTVTGDVYATFDECERVSIQSTVSPQSILSDFTWKLRDLGGDKLDAAIEYCTGGLFTTKDELADSFLTDLDNSESNLDFLLRCCGVDLSNDDTGAVVGSDAGGGHPKTTKLIVPEPVPVEEWVVPEKGSSKYIYGLTVYFPTTGANGALTDAEKHILAGLNSVWIYQALWLIDKSCKMEFANLPTQRTRSISVKFVNETNNTLAYVAATYSGNWAIKLELCINMRVYSAIDITSEDGAISNQNDTYLDRTLAHEFTHAVMAAGIGRYSDLPLFIKEGIAEFIHGIDDEKRSSIRHITQPAQRGTLQTIFSTGGTAGDEDVYSAGYLFFRYMVRQTLERGNLPLPPSDTMYNLVISDGAVDYFGNALTDNTRQIFYPDVSRTLAKAIEDFFDISILSVIPVELFAAVKRALLSNVNLFTRDKENFFSDETNPFVNPSSTVPASSYSPPVSADLPINTDGLQNFEVALAEQQLTDQVRFSAVTPFDIMQQVKGQYLDYPYNMRVERVQQQGIIYSCDCCSDVDQLLYTQMAYKIPATTTWWKIDGEEVDGMPKTVEIETVYPAASAHVNLIANSLHLTPVMQFDNFLSTVLMDEQGGVTYNDLIRDIFGWSSRVPTMLINVIIRDGKLFVIQRGHESHSVDISNAKMTVPVITKELVRTTWGSTPWSKTSTQEWESQYFVPADVIIDSSQPSQPSQIVREVMSQFNGNGTQGHTTFKYDEAGRLIQTYTYVYDSNRGGQNTYTTVNNYYDDDGTMIATETFTQSIGTEGQSTSRSVDEKHYITLPNGEKFLSQEVTKRWQNDSGLSITDNDLVDSRVTVHHPSRVGQSHVVTVSTDGEVVGESGGQNTGDDRVTPFRNKKAADFANSFDTSTGEWKTQTQETGMTVNGLSLYDSSFPIHDEATLIKVTNALRNLNRKTKETVNVALYDFEHLIDFDDKIILNGATYFLSSNTARTTPRIKFEQNLSLVRWY